jgi:hypothetical protein
LDLMRSKEIIKLFWHSKWIQKFDLRKNILSYLILLSESYWLCVWTFKWKIFFRNEQEITELFQNAREHLKQSFQRSNKEQWSSTLKFLES